MSEANLDQPVVADAPVADAPPGVDAPAPATATDDDIDTEAFDRMDAPDEDDAGADDGQPGGAPPAGQAAAGEDDEEITLSDGRKIKVPKEVALGHLRQADYTTKTQELAVERRTLATEREALATQQAEAFKTLRTEHIALGQAETQLSEIETELAEYRKFTPAQWAAEQEANPANYDKNIQRFEFLRNMRATVSESIELAKTDLKAKETALTETQQSARADALKAAWTDTNASLTKKIEGWSTGRGQELADMAVKDFGATADELKATTDPRIWLAFDEISRLRAENARLKTTSKQATATDAALKSQAVTPAVKPAGGAAKPTGVREELPTDEWMRRRNEQEARARKAG